MTPSGASIASIAQTSTLFAPPPASLSLLAHANITLYTRRIGEVVVFKIKDRDIPIVHRVLKVHEKADGLVELLTKGDNNRIDDRSLYAPGQLWLRREDILGRAVGTLRYVGMVTIMLNDYPALKYVLVGLMGLFVLTNKEG